MLKRWVLPAVCLVCFPWFGWSQQILGATHELFLDDGFIAQNSNLDRIVHPGKKHPTHPVLTATEPWEGEAVFLYGSVLRDGDMYRMWYYGSFGVAYAESAEGIIWHKPDLDLVEIDGTKTNIVIHRENAGTPQNPFHSFYELFGVLKDERDPDPARRYKMGVLSIDREYKGPREDPFHQGQRRGLGVAASPDGIHWSLLSDWSTDSICDGATHFFFDGRKGVYRLYGRTKLRSPELLEAWGRNDWVEHNYWGRSVAGITSKDFLEWDYTLPNTAPIVLSPDAADTPGDEIYGMSVFPYEGLYIGLVQVFHNQPETCYLDIQLAVSRDGERFERVGDRSPFLPVGGVGEWDRFNTAMANSMPVLVEDELRFYFSGRGYRHSPYRGPDPGAKYSAIGMASVPVDRFVSLSASFDGGSFTSPRVRLAGENLWVNADSRFGEVKIEALGAEGDVIARSLSVKGDGLREKVNWETESPGWREQILSLKVSVRNAHLYSIWSE